MKEINLIINEKAISLRDILMVDGRRVVDMATVETSMKDAEEFSLAMAIKYPGGTEFDISCLELYNSFGSDPIRCARATLAVGYLVTRNIISFRLSVIRLLIEALDKIEKPGDFARWYYDKTMHKGTNRPIAEIETIMIFAGLMVVQLELGNIEKMLPGYDNLIHKDVLKGILKPGEN